MRRPGIRSLAGGAAGIAAGIIGGVALTSVSAAGPSPVPAGSVFIDAAHLPPALTIRGEPIRLRYSIVCPPRDDGLPCDGSGTVYLRPGTTGPFRGVPLLRDDDSREGRYFLDVPPDVAAAEDGFSYYAVLRDDSTGASTTLPVGGADAPQVSRPLHDPALIALGEHTFGDVRKPDANVVQARWGSARDQVGLAGTRALGLTGPSSFDVEPNGGVDILDSVNGRVLRWNHGAGEVVPLGTSAELADLAATGDGGFDILQPRGGLTHYGGDGMLKWTQRLADRTWAKLARGQGGSSVVLEQPSEQWMPTASAGSPLTRADQADGAHTAKHVGNGHDVVVARVGVGELRLAELQNGEQLRSWRIASDTPLGEVQLAESHGNRLLVVTRAYTDDRDEFEVLVLDRKGLAERFGVASDTWTETAPLARFRTAAGALYRLRTTPSGASVDRFDLEVAQ
jgi:hypothetical protein